MIPKIIHFVWIGKEMPDWVCRNIDEFENLNPDYIVNRHTEHALREDLKDAYNKIDKNFEYSRKSDLIRLSVLYRDGGWYFDTDFWPFRKIEDIISHHNGIKEGVFFTRATPTLIANGIIGAEKEHPIIGMAIEAAKEKSNGIIGWDSYGPRLITDICSSHPEKVCIGDSDMFYPIPFEDRDIAIPEYEHFVKGKKLNGNPFTHHMHMMGRLKLTDKDPTRESQWR